MMYHGSVVAFRHHCVVRHCQGGLAVRSLSPLLLLLLVVVIVMPISGGTSPSK